LEFQSLFWLEKRFFLIFQPLKSCIIQKCLLQITSHTSRKGLTCLFHKLLGSYFFFGSNIFGEAKVRWLRYLILNICGNKTHWTSPILKYGLSYVFFCKHHTRTDLVLNLTVSLWDLQKKGLGPLNIIRWSNEIH